MDSMRNLHTSLPKTRRRQPTPQPDTHQSFRSAALSITNLYKAALADIDRARSEGYQDALEDLLGFLDKENIGIERNDRSRIRQWAMERLDGPAHGQVGTVSDSDDEDYKRARSSSPVMERNSSPEDTRVIGPAAEPIQPRSDSAPPLPTAELASDDAEMAPSPLSTMFHFSSPQPYPSNNTDNAASTYDVPTAARRAFPTPRRTTNRREARSMNMQRAAAQNIVSLGGGAGQKRKLMQDFFNVDFNHEHRRDGTGGGGGGKRGRML